MPACEGFSRNGRADGVDVFVLSGIELKGKDGTQRTGVLDYGIGAESIEEGGCGVRK